MKPRDNKPDKTPKVTKRELNPKRTRAERKYEDRTGRNPRLGIVRGRGRA